MGRAKVLTELAFLLKLGVEGSDCGLVETVPVVFQLRQVNVVVDGLRLEIGKQMRLEYLVLVLCDFQVVVELLGFDCLHLLAGLAESVADIAN